MKKKLIRLFAILVCILFILGIVNHVFDPSSKPQLAQTNHVEKYPEYQGQSVEILQNNQPYFTQEELEQTQQGLWFEPLDSLGRAQSAFGLIGKDIIPDQDQQRGSIGMVKPSGWQVARYDDLIEDKYLYNRCHLIAWSLSGENANEKNLITGTHKMNHEGMLPYEQEVLYYIRDTGDPVLYRVTPTYQGDELVCRGVEMEAYSIKDQGQGVCFHVYCFNVQPGIVIDYQTGDSWREQTRQKVSIQQSFVLNKNSKKFHDLNCPNVETIAEKNKEIWENQTVEEMIEKGYQPAGCCIKK